MAITLTNGNSTPLNPQSLVGKSAYQLAVDGGFVGTETEWRASLQGTSGKSAYQLALDAGFVGTETQWRASLQAPHPLLVTGKTGGTVGNVCLPTLTDSSILTDAVNSMKTELYDGAPLYYRRSSTEVYAAGGLVPGTFGAGDVGKLVGLGDKTAPTASNLILYPRGPLPATLTPSAVRVFVPLGVVESQTAWRFMPGMPITEADGAVQIYEAFSAVADGGAIPNTLLAQRWDGTDETLSKFEGTIRQLTTSSKRRAQALMGPGLFTHGFAGIEFTIPAGQDMNGRAVRVYLRVSGTANSVTGLVGDLNLGTGRLKIFTYLAGVGSADLAIAAGNAVTGGTSASLLHDTVYRLEIGALGNRVLARAYTPGSMPPDWLDTYQTAVTTEGYAAFSGASGALDLRVDSMSVTKNYGALKTAP